MIYETNKTYVLIEYFSEMTKKKEEEEKKRCALKNNFTDRKHFIRCYRRNSWMDFSELWAIDYLHSEGTVPPKRNLMPSRECSHEYTHRRGPALLSSLRVLVTWITREEVNSHSPLAESHSCQVSDYLTVINTLLHVMRLAREQVNKYFRF